jgi:hypothetical protein
LQTTERCPHDPPLQGGQVTSEQKPIGHKQKNHHKFLADPRAVYLHAALLLGSLIAEAVWKRGKSKKRKKKRNRVENLRGV